MPTFQIKTAPIFQTSELAVSPKRLLARLLNALVEADRSYRENRKLAQTDYPYLRDMGVDLGRTREEGRR